MGLWKQGVAGDWLGASLLPDSPDSAAPQHVCGKPLLWEVCFCVSKIPLKRTERVVPPAYVKM